MTLFLQVKAVFECDKVLRSESCNLEESPSAGGPLLS